MKEKRWWNSDGGRTLERVPKIMFDYSGLSGMHERIANWREARCSWQRTATGWTRLPRTAAMTILGHPLLRNSISSWPPQGRGGQRRAWSSVYRVCCGSRAKRVGYRRSGWLLLLLLTVPPDPVLFLLNLVKPTSWTHENYWITIYHCNVR